MFCDIVFFLELFSALVFTLWTVSLEAVFGLVCTVNTHFEHSVTIYSSPSVNWAH